MAITNSTTASTQTTGGLTAVDAATVADGTLGRATIWKMPPLLTAMQDYMREVRPGRTTIDTTHIAEYDSVGAWSEDGTINADAQGTLTNASATLVELGHSFSWSSAAELATDDPGGWLNLNRTMSVEAIWDYVAYNTTNGIAGLQASITDITTDSGGTLTWAAIREGRTALRASGHGDGILCFIDEKGLTDLENSLVSSQGAHLANPATSELVRSLIVSGHVPDDMGRIAGEYGGVVFVKVNKTGQLYATGGDTHALMISLVPMGVIPPITIACRSNPSTRPDSTVVARFGPLGIAEMPDMSVSSHNSQKINRQFSFDVFLSNSNHARNVQYAT